MPSAPEQRSVAPRLRAVHTDLGAGWPADRLDEPRWRRVLEFGQRWQSVWHEQDDEADAPYEPSHANGAKAQVGRRCSLTPTARQI